MKRIMIIISLVLIMLLLASCSGNNSQEQTAQGPTQQNQSETDAQAHENGSDTAAGAEAGAAASDKDTQNMEQTGYTLPVPSVYTGASAEPGTVIRLDYDSKDYVRDEAPVTKTAYVYTPYGYDENDTSTRYNILYLMHGWGGHAGEYFEFGNLKNLFDNLIEKGDIPPLIIVSATFYNENSNTDFSSSIAEFREFHRDFEENLMPTVEGRFHTFAESTSQEDLKASRDHRAFGGFSLGSVTTWLEFVHDYDYIRYFLPMSGSSWYYGTYGDFQIERNVDYIEQLVKDKDLDERGYFIYHAVGTNDTVKSQSIDMAEEMLTREIFTLDHYVFYLKDGGYHDYNAVREYLFNALPLFFADEPFTTKDDELVMMEEYYTAETRISEVQNDPVFGDYGRLLFPVNGSYMSGSTLGNLKLTWYSNIDPDKTVEIANYMRIHVAAGETVFYDIYTDEEKAADPAKKDTGMFFFKGDPGAKFAVCNAGGGFAYVGAMHDSFPHALELSKKGYNAFALIYRPGAQTACEDLARAIAFIFKHAEELEVNTSDYSLWGGSAGARMAAWLGSYGTESFGETAYPRPAAVIMQYTGLSEVYGNEPPTYNCVGTSDGIASYRTMQRRIDAIKANGTDAEIEVFEGLPHGFGLGTGTVAEGWLDRATAFWERNMKEASTVHSKNLSGIIPDELEYIPDGYERPAEHQGTLEKLTYDTWESFTYDQHSKKLTKEAWVYVPYGYSPDQKYNIFYLSHGGWSNETTLMGTASNPRSFKHVIDHAIEDGKMQPMIIVLPTYNNTSKSDSGDYSLALKLTDQFHNELVNDLIPAAESRYSTYAGGATSPDSLKASRDHRGFGGFSMGSVNTWCTFRYAMDYFRYFMPMSGNYTADGQYMASLVEKQGYGPEDFFIFSASGTSDFAYSSFKAQIMAMGNNAPEMFRFGKSESEGNLSFLEREGYSHDAIAMDEYTYNGLCFFWNAQ